MKTPQHPCFTPTIFRDRQGLWNGRLDLVIEGVEYRATARRKFSMVEVIEEIERDVNDAYRRHGLQQISHNVRIEVEARSQPIDPWMSRRLVHRSDIEPRVDFKIAPFTLIDDTTQHVEFSPESDDSEAVREAFQKAFDQPPVSEEFQAAVARKVADAHAAGKVARRAKARVVVDGREVYQHALDDDYEPGDIARQIARQHELEQSETYRRARARLELQRRHKDSMNGKGHE